MVEETKKFFLHSPTSFPTQVDPSEEYNYSSEDNVEDGIGVKKKKRTKRKASKRGQKNKTAKKQCKKRIAPAKVKKPHGTVEKARRDQIKKYRTQLAQECWESQKNMREPASFSLLPSPVQESLQKISKSMEDFKGIPGQMELAAEFVFLQKKCIDLLLIEKRDREQQQKQQQEQGFSFSQQQQPPPIMSLASGPDLNLNLNLEALQLSLSTFSQGPFGLPSSTPAAPSKSDSSSSCQLLCPAPYQESLEPDFVLLGLHEHVAAAFLFGGEQAIVGNCNPAFSELFPVGTRTFRGTSLFTLFPLMPPSVRLDVKKAITSILNKEIPFFHSDKAVHFFPEQSIRFCLVKFRVTSSTSEPIEMSDACLMVLFQSE